MMTIMGKQFSKRGVSVIIAALLLIAIAVAAAVLLYVFSIGLMGSLGSSGGQQTKDQVILEAYSWAIVGSAPGPLTLYLKNVGSSTVNLVPASGTAVGADYFVNGISITPTPGTPACTAAVAPGAPTCSQVLTMPSTFTPTSGAAYPVKIVLPDGGVFSYTAIAGQSS